MSINLETLLKASPWNKLPTWSELPESKRRQGRAFALGAGCGIVVAVLALWLPQVWVGFLDRRQEREALAPFVREARDLALTYGAVAIAGKALADKPVVWCVDTTSAGHAYHSGRPSEPIVWENGDAVPRNSPTTGGRCTTVVAVVVGAGREGVALRYLGIR